MLSVLNQHKADANPDMKSNVQLASCTFPVKYTNERIDITSFMDNQVKQMLQEKDRKIAKGKKINIIK